MDVDKQSARDSLRRFPGPYTLNNDPRSKFVRVSIGDDFPIATPPLANLTYRTTIALLIETEIETIDRRIAEIEKEA